METHTFISKSIHWKALAVELISYGFVILFIYAGLYKLLDFQVFVISLEQSPLISPLAHLLAYAVPFGEILVALILLVGRTRLIGLYLSTLIMAGFTIYIAYMLLYVPDLPCQCGGILAKMGWKEHLVFNACFIVLGITGTILQTRAKRSS